MCAGPCDISPRIIRLVTIHLASRKATLALHLVLQYAALAAVQRPEDGLVEDARTGTATTR